MFRRSAHLLSLTLVTFALGCGGSSGSSGTSTPAPAPGPDDWQLEVVNQANAPFELYIMSPSGIRGERIGRIHTRATATFNVNFQPQGLRIELVDEAEERTFTSDGVMAPKGIPLRLTISQEFEALITSR